MYVQSLYIHDQVDNWYVEDLKTDFLSDFAL